MFTNNDYFIALKKYLLEKGWAFDDESNDKLYIFKAPDYLGYENESYIRIFKNIGDPQLKDYLINMIKTAANHHNESIQSVELFLPSEDNFFSLRLYDKEIIENTISMVRATKIIDFIEQFLKQVSEFTLKKSVWFDDKYSDVTANFIKSCRIEPFEKGSFIIKTKLPRNSDFPQQLSLLSGSDVLEMNDLNNNISNILNIIINDVINSDKDITKDYILENKEYININILESLKSLFSQAKITDLDFNLKTDSIKNAFVSKDIVAFNRKRLNDFIDKTKEILLDIIEIKYEGIVFEYKSKNPDNPNNHVEIWSFDPNTRVTTKISCKLDCSDYNNAVFAYNHKKKVFIQGIAIKTPNKYRMNELKLFKVIE
ncbi:MAG: hypothetical protein ACK4IX_01250 [Candidatus Sericytochromatia bacterium]